MARIITDYLDETVKKYSEKIAFSDEKRDISFGDLQDEAHHIAISLLELGFRKKPIIIYLDKSVECIAAFEGVNYSGNFYSPVDTKMPSDRILKIIEKLCPAAIITDHAHANQARRFAKDVHVLCYEEMQNKVVDYDIIESAKNEIVDSDILYVLFTSGSTGTPKGAIISHRGMIDLTEWLSETLQFSENNIMANQTPFYFSYSVCEIYQTLKNGCKTYIITQNLFRVPPKLMRYLDEKNINTLFWVPSILIFISTLKALNRPHLSKLKMIVFGGEVMSTKHLNRWIEEYPEVIFVNSYGSTEVTDTCAAYVIDRNFKDDEIIPIGRSCKNKDTFLLREDNKLITQPNEIGEICVRGSGIACGYYNDSDLTAKAFVQNPINNSYPELIYRMGDLGKYNEKGELVYICRKDYQIKHKGHRIELGEIESIVSSIETIEEQCCIYDDKKLRIVLFYVGEIDGKILLEYLKNELPEYMVPGVRIKLNSMPKNLSGKIDRKKLKEMLNN